MHFCCRSPRGERGLKSRAWYCPGCRLERRREMDARRHRAGSARHLGDTDKCVVCGADYIVTGGNQRYCPDCAPSAVAEKDRQQSLEWYAENKAEYNPGRNEKRRIKQVACTVCGKLFDCGGKPTKVCSPECKEKRRKQWQREADAKRYPRKKQDVEKRERPDEE